MRHSLTTLLILLGLTFVSTTMDGASPKTLEVGTTAPDFRYTSPQGKTTHFYSLPPMRTLLFFYDPDCEGCESLLTQLRYSEGTFNEYRKGTLRIMAIYAGDEPEKWIKKMREMPTEWVHGKINDQDRFDRKKYQLAALPLLLVIDRNHQIETIDSLPWQK